MAQSGHMIDRDWTTTKLLMTKHHKNATIKWDFKPGSCPHTGNNAQYRSALLEHITVEPTVDLRVHICMTFFETGIDVSDMDKKAGEKRQRYAIYFRGMLVGSLS